MDAERKENTKIQVSFCKGEIQSCLESPGLPAGETGMRPAGCPCIETDTIHVAHSLSLDKVRGSRSIFSAKGSSQSVKQIHPFSLSHTLFSMVSEHTFLSDEMEQDTIMFKKISLPSPQNRIQKTKHGLFQDVC